ncbi:hypothetical protein I3W98_34600, partial [Streptomyces cavourensis]|nr:hypothetical protein [Streptomyces cavourensis]
MSFPSPGRHSGAAHHEHCNTVLCCRCQMRVWTTQAGNERLCGPCAACCQACGRAPAPHLDGLQVVGQLHAPADRGDDAFR